MPFGNTHVTFTNSAGSVEVGVVKSYGGGQYEIELKNGSHVRVPESNVSKLAVSDPSACPVVGH
ncbi:hypothetical protein TWF696_009194 [Orbilia brochopaga]|uniref:Uncharacterized protein n=1 Tax=Orbilia brochopaga TaxID=3140254 RepID=A0AAV9UI04_9PEZI